MRQDPHDRPLPVTSYALLGLLTFGDELTGYELKQRADITLRFYWVSPAMSQVYSELKRLTELTLVEASDDLDDGRRTTRYRITAQGREVLEAWMSTTPAGFSTLKHPVALRLLMGHVVDDATTRAMLTEYLDEVGAARSDLREVRESLRGADAPGEAFRYPALVADWGLRHFDSEEDAARAALRELGDPG